MVKCGLVIGLFRPTVLQHNTLFVVVVVTIYYYSVCIQVARSVLSNVSQLTCVSFLLWL